MGEWVKDEEALREFVESFPPEQRDEVRRQMKVLDARWEELDAAMREARQSTKH